MMVSDRTLRAVAKAIRKSIKCSHDDHDLAQAALQALIDNASLNDWDALGIELTLGWRKQG